MSALRLEQGTELNRTPGAYREGYGFDPLTEGVQRVVTVRRYSNDLVEVGYSSVHSAHPDRERETDRGDSPDKKTEKVEPNEKSKASNFIRSVRRSKAQVRRKCMAGGLDHLLTLTYRENFDDVDAAYTHLKRFIRLVRKRYPDWRYCAVHELQKRGAVHFHLAVHGYQDVRFLRATWLRVVGAGNIDVQAPRGRGPAKWKLPRLAGYLSKYIMKSATPGNGRQRYRVSEGIDLPKDTFIYVLERGRSIVGEIFDSFGVNVAYHWEHESTASGWACSWET